MHMKLNLSKIHDIVTLVAVIGMALTFLLQVLSVSVGVLSLGPVIMVASVAITMGTLAATGISIVLSLYRTANK